MFSFSYRNAKNNVGTFYKSFVTNQLWENIKKRLQQFLDGYSKNEYQLIDLLFKVEI